MYKLSQRLEGLLINTNLTGLKKPHKDKKIQGLRKHARAQPIWSQSRGKAQLSWTQPREKGQPI